MITAADAGNVQADHTANHITTAAGKQYSYDGNGNITSDGIRTFAYNQDNRLVRVKIGGNVVGEYAYDAFGRRVKKIASGVTTLYHYAGGNLIAETDQDGNTLRNYIYLNGEPVALRIYGTQDGMYYFLNDRLGTPQKILNSSAQVVWSAGYLPFGKAQVTTETVANNLRFPGQYYDAESGLHYNWNRYYDPDTGRYITADPIGLAGGINLYAYVMGNPVNRMDPFGLLQADIDEVLSWLNREYPELTRYLSNIIYLPIKKLSGGHYCGTGLGSSTILLDKDYRDKELSELEKEELYETITHELLHNYVNRLIGMAYYAMTEVTADVLYRLPPGSKEKEYYHGWIREKSAEIQSWRDFKAAGTTKPDLIIKIK